MKALFFGFLLLFTIFSCISAQSAPEVKEEEDVMILTKENFEHVITSNQHVLIEFCKYFIFSLFCLV